MPNTKCEDPKQLALALKALADKNRLKILSLLLNKQYCVKSLAKKLSISESSVSQHLKKLREAGLVVGVKKGYWVHYSVQEEKLAKLSNELKNLEQYTAVEDKNCCK